MSRRTTFTAIAVGVLASVVTAATTGPAAGTTPRGDDDGVTITLVTHDSFSVSKGVLADFTEQTGVGVEVLPAGDAGEALNQVILTKEDPIGDVLFGVDNTFLSRALEAGIYERYEPPEVADVPTEYQIDPTHHVTPVDHGDVCVNYDKGWFADAGLRVPTTLEDLARPRYRGLLVVENPATSSPGLAFVLATIARLGESGWRDYWTQLRDNDVRVVSGWEQAYNGEFTAGEGAGDRPLVVSYASSPSAAVYYSDPRPDESPIGTILSTCFRQVETVGILKGTEHRRAARALVDFMLSRRFQEDIPLQMFVFPVREGVRLPRVFAKFAEVPGEPLSLPAPEIGRERETWVREWDETVLR